MKSLSPLRRIISSGFTIVNFVLRPSRIKSPSSIMHCKTAGNKRKMAIKEMARDRIYNLLE